MKWYWWHVRRAKIPQYLRDELEHFGETVVASAVSISYDWSETQQSLRDFYAFQPIRNLNAYMMPPPPEPLLLLVTEHRKETLEWLNEKRDLAERKEKRQEAVDIAILIFVAIGVLLDLWHALHGAGAR